jgi:COMPASS component SWD3
LIKLWDGVTGEFIETLQGHTEGISDIAWASDGEYIASASDDKTVKIWSMEEVSIRQVEAKILRLSSFSAVKWRLSSAIQILFSAWTTIHTRTFSYLEGMMKQFEFGTLQEVPLFLSYYDYTSSTRTKGKPLKVLPAHSDPVTAVSFNHDGTLVVSCAMDGLMYVYLIITLANADFRFH